METSTATTAFGGSASSQADTLERAAWSPRTSVAFTIRLVVLVLPVIASVLAVWICATSVPAPAGRIAFWSWMAGLVAISCTVSFATQRVLRRLAPLALLFQMSLIFPDEAPTRFGLALRTGTFRSLARRVGRAREPDGNGEVWTEQRSAEHLVAAMSRLSRHDRLTTGHSERVRAYAVLLGQEIDLSRDELDRLNWAALIHDVGKLDVPSEILNKPGRPTPDEWAVLRGHPGAGWRYVDPLRPWLGDWVDATTQHHERWDGDGYPLGLGGHDISLAGRIVAIADAFDVMTAARSYKKPLPASQARAELTLNSGTQFDPRLVRSFLQISIGRMRRVIGPLGVLAHFPDVIRVPLTAALSSSTAIVTAGAIAVGAAAGAVAPHGIALPSGSEESTPVMTDAPPDATPAGTPAPPPGSTPALTPPPPPAWVLAPTMTPATPPPPPASVLTPTIAPATPNAMPAPTPAPAPTTIQASGTSAAIDDDATTRTNQKVSIHVLANDDFAGSAIDFATLAAVLGPEHGTVKVAGQNLLYDPADGFVGTDTMRYQVCSTLGVCDQATVTVTVRP